MTHSESAEEREKRLIVERANALPRFFGDRLLEGIGEPDRRLVNESTEQIALHALGYIQELAARVQACCANPHQSDGNELKVCDLVVNVARDATAGVHFLSRQFPTLFRQIAEQRAIFPCLFPAHAEDLTAVEEFILQELQLGKAFPLKLHPGRKTFSKRTPVNNLLFHYLRRIDSLKMEMLRIRLADPFTDGCLPPSEIEKLPDLSKRTAKRWLDVIWTLLLEDCPTPETNSLLASLGKRRSRTARASYGNDRAGYARSAIKEALGTYLARMLRESIPPTDKTPI